MQRSPAAVSRRAFWSLECLQETSDEREVVCVVRFAIPLMAAHALLEEAVFARAASAGLDATGVEFEDSNTGAQTLIGCSNPVAQFLLEELRRIRERWRDDVELSFSLTEAAIVVQEVLNGAQRLPAGPTLDERGLID